MFALFAFRSHTYAIMYYNITRERMIRTRNIKRIMRTNIFHTVGAIINV